MADTVTRIRAGATGSISLTPASTSGTFTAKVLDAAGRRVKASATVSAPNVTVSINADDWHDGRPGIGYLELKQVDGGVTSFPVTRRLRIMPGIDAYGETADDYPW